MSDLAAALVASLDDASLDRLAEALLRPRLVSTDAPADSWLNTREAASYLGLSVDALHKLTAARRVPFSQDTAGGKCWFLRSELDEWRRGGG